MPMRHCLNCGVFLRSRSVGAALCKDCIRMSVVTVLSQLAVAAFYGAWRLIHG
jgi:NMD protein affecting ribosome stability and mRNA decay